jgi:large-conductance mechanosensitive channel
MFVAITGKNRLMSVEPPAAPPAPPKEVELLTEIRDALKAR